MVRMTENEWNVVNGTGTIELFGRCRLNDSIVNEYEWSERNESGWHILEWQLSE